MGVGSVVFIVYTRSGLDSKSASGCVRLILIFEKVITKFAIVMVF